MRLIITVVALALLTGGAGAASRAKQCRQACGGLIDSCGKTTAAAGFGHLTRGCTQSVLKRCKKKGPAVCGMFCGNGVIDAGEQCDGMNLGGATCATVGFVKGTLKCGPTCLFNTSGCRASTVPSCGNGVREGAEECDHTDLGGATCASLGFSNGGTLACTTGCGFNVSGCKSQAFPATGQTTCWNSGGAVIPCGGTGHDGDTHTGTPLAYVDNGDGTITDTNTGFMWEKQSLDGSVHDEANAYTWDLAFSGHVATLNAMNFAGHNNWRVPNVRELQSIANYQNSAPAVSPAFNTNCTASCTVLTCSCTASSLYWSSTTYATSPTGAWTVFFSGGIVSPSQTSNNFAVRGVRGGS